MPVTPLARWYTHRIALMGAGMTLAQGMMDEHVKRHEAAVAKIHRLLSLLDSAANEAGDLAAEMEHGLNLLERLAVAKERAECELANEVAEQRRGPCGEQVA